MLLCIVYYEAELLNSDLTHGVSVLFLARDMLYFKRYGLAKAMKQWDQSVNRSICINALVWLTNTLPGGAPPSALVFCALVRRSTWVV